jgi:hypothetical protein
MGPWWIWRLFIWRIVQFIVMECIHFYGVDLPAKKYISKYMKIGINN